MGMAHSNYHVHAEVRERSDQSNCRRPAPPDHGSEPSEPRPEGAVATVLLSEAYAVRGVSLLSPEIAACAAARRAIGTRYGEQET